MLKRKTNLIKYFLPVIIYFGFLNIAFAASLNLTPNTGSYNVGDTVTIRMTVSSSSSINAVSANIKYNKDVLSLSSVSKSGTVISLWAQEPDFRVPGTVSLEGVMLSGYTGNSGTIVTLVFKAKSVGTAEIKFNSASVLANDGEGTNILNNFSSSAITVNSKTENININPKPTTIVNDSVKKEVVAKNQTNLIKIEQVQDSNTNINQAKFLITTTDEIKNNAYSIQIDNQEIFSYTDDGTHVYTTPILPRGVHTLRASALNSKNENISAVKEFTILPVMQPIITDYPSTLLEGKVFNIKGFSDPNTNIYLTISDNNKKNIYSYVTKTNNSGVFDFVSSEKINSGIYTLIAYAVSDDEVKSLESSPVSILVNKSFFAGFVNFFKDISGPLAVIVILLLILLIALVHLIYKILSYKHKVKEKITEIKKYVNKSFTILKEDENVEIEIIKKLANHKSFDDDDKAQIKRLNKDIDDAENVIFKKMDDIGKL